MKAEEVAKVQRAPDPRPARTRAAIIKAIERLGSTDNLLTVSSVVEEAGLSRSSFYSQFEDLGDVAVQLIAQLREDILRRYESARSSETPVNLWLLTIEMLISEFHKRRNLYKVVLSSSASLKTQRNICTILSGTEPVGNYPALPDNLKFEIYSRYLAAGTVGALVAWINSENPLSETEMQLHLQSMLPAWMSTEI